MPRPLIPSEGSLPASPSGPPEPPAEEQARLSAFFRERSHRMEPLPPPPLPEPFASLSGNPLPRRPRALILDVYGTLLVSGAGEVGTAASEAAPGSEALAEALQRCGVEMDPASFEESLQREILADHEKARGSGIPWPEVDGAAILARMTGKSPPEARLLGAAREAALNPAFPMPGAAELLKKAGKAGLVLGIVSNAQYYTVPVLEAAFGRGLSALGFLPDLCVWSWKLGRAKPDPELFRVLSRALAVRGIEPGEAVYIGNDLLNDIAPAREEGYRTALFAGDARSLRLREGDSRTKGVLPDTVLASFLGSEAPLRLARRDPFLCLPRTPA